MNTPTLPAFKTVKVSLGDLITTLYEEFLVTYGNEEQASVATADSINKILAQQSQPQLQDN